MDNALLQQKALGQGEPSAPLCPGSSGPDCAVTVEKKLKRAVAAQTLKAVACASLSIGQDHERPTSTDFVLALSE
jgi:hypothetical protein